MQVVIDIPEDAYKLLKNEGVDWLGAEHILNAVANGTPLPKGHGRLIDADALADRIQEVSVLQRYEDIKIERRCTVADVLTSLTHDLRGTALCGYELCPTIVEADTESEDKE